MTKIVVSADELKRWIKTGEILRHLFQYREAVLSVYDLRLFAKPFIFAFLLRVLSLGTCMIRDQRGKIQEVTMSFLVSRICAFLKDFFAKKKLLEAVSHEIGLLQKNTRKLYRNNLKNREFGKEAPQNFQAQAVWSERSLPSRQGASEHENFEEKPTPPKTDSSGCFGIHSGRPVYLRTDYFFGMQSGGSVGHIAGVLNHFDRPIFITSDWIPTVRKDLETHRILPSGAFRDFRSLPAIHYNEGFFQGALKQLGDRKPSFIYQRYSANHFSGVKLANHFQIPFVLEYNGSEVWVNRWWGSKSKYEGLLQEIEMINLRQSDLVVVVSRVLKEELISRGIEEEKILVNPNGVDPEVYSPGVDGSKIREQYDLRGIVIGFIGTFGQWHGAEILAEAFGKLPHDQRKVQLFLIGDGKTLPAVKKILNGYGVTDHCRFSGMIPQHLGPSYLAACDLFVSPHVPNPDGTPFFGSPTKIFEYMAMGKAIVASNLDQIGEILKHEETAWLVRPADPMSLTAGMKELIGDEQKRIRLGLAARREVILRYTWEKHTQKILDRLNRLLAVFLCIFLYSQTNHVDPENGGYARKAREIGIDWHC